MNDKMPPEVVEYFKNGTRKIVKVTPTNDYSLILVFDNDEVREYHMKDKLTGVFKILKDINKFQEVFIDEYGCIAWDIDKNIDSNIYWNNRIDLCTDSVYIYSTLLNIDNIIELFANKKTTLAKASELAHMSIGEFVEVLINHNIPWGEHTEGDMEIDNEAINKILSEENNNMNNSKETTYQSDIRKIVKKSIKDKGLTDEDLQNYLVEIRQKWVRNPQPRNTNRIDIFLKTLGEYWKTSPDLRFGQIVSILDDEAKKLNKDPFYIEENQWEEILNELIQNKNQ